MNNRLDRDFGEEIIEKKRKRQKFKLLKNYYRASSGKEKVIDLLLPFILILILISITSVKTEWSNIGFAKSILSSTDIIVNVMAILAGFNTASLSIIGTANMKMVSEDTTNKIIDYFSFAILFQLVILIIGIVLKFSSGYLLNIGNSITLNLNVIFLEYVLIIVGSIWYAAVISSILISIRSLPIISNIIKLMVKK
ncbi:hypothetical protein [Listeria sp. ILCC792]|uniref:hypothetical protein n=1 Tax=Listeria sp. ILCC792 TaxID=1918331 RepID=UPI000B597ECE|nr:hypothetical protein [Listeria sp. ILCC792]